MKGYLMDAFTLTNLTATDLDMILWGLERYADQSMGVPLDEALDLIKRIEAAWK
jgi:hypothetical protein